MKLNNTESLIILALITIILIVLMTQQYYVIFAVLLGIFFVVKIISKLVKIIIRYTSTWKNKKVKFEEIINEPNL